MTLQEYIKKNIGKKIDFDNAYGYQCVDLARDYARNVLGVSLGPSGGSAKTMFENKSGTFNNNWEKIINNPKDKNQTPQVGDIIFWTMPPYGHVAMVTKIYPGKNKVEVLEQNAGTGTGTGIGSNAIRLKTYKYYLGKNNKKNIAGWFHYKKEDKLEFKKLYEDQVEKNKKLLAENINLRNKIDQVKDFINKM